MTFHCRQQCPDCESVAMNAIHGIYRMDCLPCCVRLVASARPVRALQEKMLAAIARFPDAPKRSAILARLQGETA